jgi:uncharacterized protein (DUF885 family)
MGAVAFLADRHLDRITELDPYLATALGVRGYDDQITDYSPEGCAERIAVTRATLAALDGVQPTDDPDRRCGALLRDRLRTESIAYEAGEHLRALRIIASPVSDVREIFDITPRDTPDEWAVLARRMAAVPGAYAGVEAALREGMRQGLYAAPRQAEACAGQTATWAGIGGGTPWFAGLAAEGPDALRPELDAAAAAATESLVRFTAFLRDEYAPAASGTPDAVGRDRYVVSARRYLGADLDVDDAYEYGWSELQRIEAEMIEVGSAIRPGVGLVELFALLDAEGEAVEGEDALLRTLQELMDDAIVALDGTHFDISARSGGSRRRWPRRGRRRRRTTSRRRWTSAGPGARGTRRSAATASRSGRTSAPGTTRVSPGTTCSWPAGSPPATGSRATSGPSTWRAMRRDGRCTPSG